jgi:hypothetical protein
MADDKPAAQPVQALTIEQGCALLGRSRVWLQMRIKEKYIIRVDGALTIVALVQGAIAYYEDLLAKASKSAAATRVTDARTKEIELRMAERQRQLIPVEDAQAVVLELAATMRAELYGLPVRYTRDITERRKLESEVNDVLRRMADRAGSSAEALALGGGNLAAIGAA